MTAPAGKPITNGKVEGRVPLESLFDEVENDGGSPKYNDEETKKKHPSVKKIGSWESEGTSILSIQQLSKHLHIYVYGLIGHRSRRCVCNTLCSLLPGAHVRVNEQSQLSD
jgi:hypothetical protein